MSVSPEIGWLPPSLMRSRIDANFNRATAVAARARIKAIATIKDLSDVSTDIVCGPFGSTLVTSDIDPNGDVVLVQPTDISGDLFNAFPEWKITDSVRRERGLNLYDAETMVFARVGIYPHCGVLPPTIGKATIGSRIIAATIDPNQSDPYFLMAFFRTRFGKIILYSIQKITAQPVIGTEELSSAVVPCPNIPVQRSIGHKIRAAERLRATASSTIARATNEIHGLLHAIDYSVLCPNPDGACDYFSGFVSVVDLGLFNGAQFYAPKRKQAVALIKATGIGERLGNHGTRVRSKAKQSKTRGHVDPANVSGGDGYWYSGDSVDGGDIVLAKPGHTLFLRMRPYLNKTTINDTDHVVSGSSEFLVYEFEGLDAYYATLCLRQPWALAQVAEIATGDRPRVDGEFVDEVVVPWPDQTVRHEVGRLYQSSFALRRRAERLVQQAIADVENLIDGKLDEDKCLAEGRELAQEFGLELP